MTRQHGTLAAFVVDVCRCEPCKAASRRYENRRNRLMAYGQWEPYVDAEPARQHVEMLRQFGLSWMQVARISGVPRGSVSKLIYGDGPRGMAPSKRIRPKTAAAILALEPNADILADGAMVDGTGTRRRLQALIYLGWSQNRLADHLNVERSNLGQMLRSDAKVRCGTARAVRSLYDELWDQAPPESGHRERISASRARNYARQNGWAPPMAWDDDHIEDPAAVADLGAKTWKQTAVAENAAELIDGQGYTVEQAAERLGVTRSYIEHARRRVAQDDEVAA